MEEDIVGKPMSANDLFAMIARMQERMEEGQSFTDASIPEVVENLYADQIDGKEEA